MKKPSLLIIFLTVFIDLIGFGIVLPLLPTYSQDFGASGFLNGAIMASFSAMQFLFAPMWGRLSDKIGRRPVLLISTFGSAISYTVFAVGSGLADHKLALWVMLGSRLFAGMCGATINVAQAYIADITPPEDRSRRMGLIGMAFGLGFIFGPALGWASHKWFGITGPGWVASAFCAVNLVLAFFVLVESWKPSSEHVAPRPRFAQWVQTLQQPQVGLLILLFFLATFCFTCFEMTLGLLVIHNFNLGFHSGEESRTIAGPLFAYCGIIGAMVQGGAIGRLVKKLGEPKLITLSLVLVAVSLAPLPFIHGDARFSWGVLLHPEGLPWLELLFVLALLSIGSGLTRPPVFGMISMLTPATEQGATIGVAQSAGSLARIVGPIFASTLFEFTPAVPYLICSGVSLLAAILASLLLCKPAPAVVSGNAQNAG